ncbi:Lrp/AsnC family transcriptional regulator [Sphingobium sp. AP50]|uniref:Lrp/AsnC family transcriptional regulator n=1 Tax=Sphingobium sp. AP50 TaxID=1884369 RepID=UPI0008B166C3|nr:Lrp/AsnC family transcriptional regulator [Sphingobium sp. AP50]SEJ98633.1 Lrp/AsnC family transcriptional regulator [Sphingobium sp. AP50]
MMMQPQIDDTDRRLLRAYQSRPDLSIAELAEEVGLSSTPCWRRLKRLEEIGVIIGRANILNPVALGYPVNVFAHMKLRVHDAGTLDAFEAAIRQIPNIVECFSMSGDSDYVVRVVAKSIEDYERILRTILLSLPNVLSVNSSFTLGSVKLTAEVPL